MKRLYVPGILGETLQYETSLCSRYTGGRHCSMKHHYVPGILGGDTAVRNITMFLVYWGETLQYKTSLCFRYTGGRHCSMKHHYLLSTANGLLDPAQLQD